MIQINPDKQIDSSDINMSGGNLDDVLNNLILIRSFAITSNYPTINANTTSDISIPSYSLPSGYYPIGIIQVSTGQQQLVLEAYIVDATSCSLRIRNVTSNNLTCGPSIRVAFMKDEYINR